MHVHAAQGKTLKEAALKSGSTFDIGGWMGCLLPLHCSWVCGLPMLDLWTDQPSLPDADDLKQRAGASVFCRCNAYSCSLLSIRCPSQACSTSCERVAVPQSCCCQRLKGFVGWRHEQGLEQQGI